MKSFLYWQEKQQKNPNCIGLKPLNAMQYLLPESSFITLRDGLCSSQRWISVGFASLSRHFIKGAILYFIDCKIQLE